MIAKFNTKYKREVNSVIMKAKKYTDERCKRTNFSDLQDFNDTWNNIYHTKMDQLTVQFGRIKL